MIPLVNISKVMFTQMFNRANASILKTESNANFNPIRISLVFSRVILKYNVEG